MDSVKEAQVCALCLPAFPASTLDNIEEKCRSQSHKGTHGGLDAKQRERDRETYAFPCVCVLTPPY